MNSIPSYKKIVTGLVVELEEHWLFVHDDYCSNIHDCTSFDPTSTKQCRSNRPDILVEAKLLVESFEPSVDVQVCEGCYNVYSPVIKECAICGKPNSRLK